jgi:hypothetical protein
MVQSDARGRRAPTPAALASLGSVPDGYRILPDPLHGQPLLRVPAQPAEVRVLLDRSLESVHASEPTQDYLVVRCDSRRISFAVTDGVGSSFLGDVAAQILAAHVADWLIDGAPAGAGEAFTAAFDAFLHRLSRQVMDQVATWPIPEHVTGLVRAALDQQRAYGSEAMVACGVVDLTGNRDAAVTVAWLGDTHLRVIMRDGEQIDHSGQTSDRWSSRLGPRGTVCGRSWPAARVARVIACTDGLLPGLGATVELPDAALGARLTELARRSGSDDMALVDVGLAPRAMPGDGPATGSTLWRRLSEEPGRHARTTVAGTALRRLMRAVGPTTRPSGGAASPSRGSSAGSADRLVPVPSGPDQARPPASIVDGGAPAVTGPGAAASGVAGAPGVDATWPRWEGEQSGPSEPSAVVEPFVAVEAPTGVGWRYRDRGRELTWSAVEGADSYAVEVSREPGFAEPLLYAVAGLSFVLPPLAGPVFVRVRAVADGEPGPWGLVLEVSDAAGAP